MDCLDIILNLLAKYLRVSWQYITKINQRIHMSRELENIKEIYMYK